MHQTNTIVVSSNSTQKIRLYINKELFIDQNLPYNRTKLTVNFTSDSNINEVLVTDGNISKTNTMSPNETVNIDMNK